jgi:hypothetical protein
MRLQMNKEELQIFVFWLGYPMCMWSVRDHRGLEMFRFPDCGNVNKRFIGLKKDKVNILPNVPHRVSEYKDIPKEWLR